MKKLRREESVSLRTVLAAGSLVFACTAPAAIAQSVDAAAAEALAKKSGCLTCHSVTQKKAGPSFKEVAAKYKGKPDAEKALDAVRKPQLGISAAEKTQIIRSYEMLTSLKPSARVASSTG